MGACDCHTLECKVDMGDTEGLHDDTVPIKSQQATLNLAQIYRERPSSGNLGGYTGAWQPGVIEMYH